MIPRNNFSALDKRSEASREERFNFRFNDTAVGSSVNPANLHKEQKQDVYVRNQNNIGIYTNPNMISLPCRTVEEANGKVVLGNMQPFDKSLVSAIPYGWDSKMTYIPARAGFSHDFDQTPLQLHTFRR